MRKIISSIDIGTNSIKLIVGELTDGRLNILSAIKTPTAGLEFGKIIDREALVNSIKKCVKDASNNLGIDIKKIILGVNAINAKLVKSYGEIKIKREEKIINGEDVASVIQRCADGKVDEDYTLLGVIPVDFGIDGNIVTKDPKGCESENLAIKGIVVTSEKEYVIDLLKVCEDAGLKVIDIIPNSLGDYYTYKTNESDNEVVATINLGNESTTVSIFNRGILTNMRVLNIGVQNIVNDIAYVKRLDMNTARALYEDITLGNSSLANPNEYRLVRDLEGLETNINQFELSEIAESRIQEILNLAKKQINILTKKEISYIIIAGGLSELKDFSLTEEEVMGKNSKIGHINLIGARDNSYASAIGIIKYFDKKISLRGKTFSIFAPVELEDMNNGVKTSSKENSLLGKVFGYFFDS